MVLRPDFLQSEQVEVSRLGTDGLLVWVAIRRLVEVYFLGKKKGKIYTIQPNERSKSKGKMNVTIRGIRVGGQVRKSIYEVEVVRIYVSACLE